MQNVAVGVAFGVAMGVAFCMIVGDASSETLARKKVASDKPLSHPLGL